jgi:hypoxanthine phosphoribosyltransferase
VVFGRVRGNRIAYGATVSEGLRTDLKRVLFDEAQIAARVAELGAQIQSDYADRRLMCVGILKGSFPFLADLVRGIDLPLTVDFMAVSSYKGTKSTGVVKIVKDLDRDLAGKHLLIVEDIVDTGLTLKYLLENLATRKPESIEVCSLLDKSAVRKQNVDVRYAGFDCPDEFVVGYGLDYNGRYRNLPVIGVLRESVYSDD